MSRQHLLEQASYPIDARHGTPYPCRQRDLDIVRQHASRNEGPFVSQGQATLEVVNHNDPRRRLPSYEREAICRLSDALRDSARYDWGPDLVIKAFLDLDLVFFGGVLRSYVCVLWDSMENFADRGTSQGRTAVSPRPGNARIYLNAQAILLCRTPFRHMFSTVLHEMCVSTIHPSKAEDNRFFLWLC